MEIQLHHSLSSFLREEVIPVRNHHFFEHTVVGCGFWTSTYRDGSSDFIDYITNHPEYVWRKRTRWLLTPDPSARILTIATKNDLDKLYWLYRLRNGGLHFEAMSVSYDALSLTREGVLENADSLFVEEWSTESTLWFRWCFTHAEQIEDDLFSPYTYRSEREKKLINFYERIINAAIER